MTNVPVNSYVIHSYKIGIICCFQLEIVDCALLIESLYKTDIFYLKRINNLYSSLALLDEGDMGISIV